MKKFIFILFFSVGTIWAASAQNTLLVQGTTGSLHLAHKVSAKETWFAIGRLYNISPKDLASFNSLSLDQPLAIGQSIRFHLLQSLKDGTKDADEVFVPLYHVIQENEWMYRISVNHNKYQSKI